MTTLEFTTSVSRIVWTGGKREMATSQTKIDAILLGPSNGQNLRALIILVWAYFGKMRCEPFILQGQNSKNSKKN